MHSYCSGCRAPCSFPEFGCSGHAVYAMSHKVDAASCDGGCNAQDVGCSDPGGISVCLQYHFSWMQCPCCGCSAPCTFPECGSSAHAVAVVSEKSDAVCFDRGFNAHEGGSSEPAMSTVHLQSTFSGIQSPCMVCIARCIGP